jgi:hypothetical protein
MGLYPSKFVDLTAESKAKRVSAANHAIQDVPQTIDISPFINILANLQLLWGRIPIGANKHMGNIGR